MSTCMSKKVKRNYRLFLCVFFVFVIGLMGTWYFKELEKRVPNHIYLFRDQNTLLNLSAPLSGQCHTAKEVLKIMDEKGHSMKSTSFSLGKPFAVEASSLGSYQAELKIFGLIHYKNIHFDVIEKAKVMPSGKAAGLYIRSKGLLVLGTTRVQGKDGLSYEPAGEILKAGDTVQKIDGRSVETIDELAAILQTDKRKQTTLSVKRNGNLIRVKVDKVLGKDGAYKLGVWLREDIEGIGTISFITEKNQFAALGHGITDIDTGKVIPVHSGKVYPAQIEDIKKGESGKPGELIGSVTIGEEICMGEIKSNSSLGITGRITKESEKYQENKALPIGLKHEVKKGKAQILCQAGAFVERFEIGIEEINLNSKDNKGMVIRITDKELLKRTGGIVQGMSGAPVIQNGKVIGAVTHVFVDDPTSGYATFIENQF